jgi:hypothetical protein
MADERPKTIFADKQGNPVKQRKDAAVVESVSAQGIHTIGGTPKPGKPLTDEDLGF